LHKERRITINLRTPRVSIVMTAYQASHFVPAVLQQLRALTFTDFEVIVVDDGSTDDTVALLRVGAELDERIRVIEQFPNAGAGAARRAGFSAATGEFVWNIDMDDEWPPDALETLASASEGVDLVFAPAWRRSPDGAVRLMPSPDLSALSGAREVLTMMLSGAITGHLWNKFVRRSLLTPDVYTDARIHSDLVMVARLSARLQAVRAVDRPVYTYVENPGSNIRSSKPRGDALDDVALSVAESVAFAAPELIDSSLYARFFARAIVLSRLRDAVRGDYSPDERRTRYRSARAAVRPAHIFALLRTRDVKNTGLLLIAWATPPVFRRLMAR